MPPTTYLTPDDLATVIGTAHLIAAAPDPAQDDTWHAETVERAIASVGARVDAALRSAYALPLPDVPDFLRRAVARLVHAELVSEATSTALIESRRAGAEKLVAQVAAGTLRIGGDLDGDDATDANARTRQGKAVLVQPGARQFRRRDTTGVV